MLGQIVKTLVAISWNFAELESGDIGNDEIDRAP